MKTFERNYLETGSNEPIKTPLDIHTDRTKNMVNNTLWNEVADKLKILFGMNDKEKFGLKQLAKRERQEFSNENEVNTIEAQLAALFGSNTYENMINLNKKEKAPLSMESVLSRFDVLQAA